MQEKVRVFLGDLRKLFRNRLLILRERAAMSTNEEWEFGNDERGELSVASSIA